MSGARNAKHHARVKLSDDIRTVIFDLDGTLYDRHGLAKRMVKRLWWCLPLMAIDRTSHGAVWRWIVSTRWHREVYLKTMVDLIATTCPRREDVIAFVQTCQTRGIQTAIYSDYGCVQEKLAVLGVDANAFDLLITGPEVGGLKPEERCVRAVMERLHADPNTTLFVGDRDEKDGACARLVGARFWLVV